jgi:hypothetical protein
MSSENKKDIALILYAIFTIAINVFWLFNPWISEDPYLLGLVRGIVYPAIIFFWMYNLIPRIF